MFISLRLAGLANKDTGHMAGTTHLNAVDWHRRGCAKRSMHMSVGRTGNALFAVEQYSAMASAVAGPNRTITCASASGFRGAFFLRCDFVTTPVMASWI